MNIDSQEFRKFAVKHQGIGGLYYSRNDGEQERSALCPLLKNSNNEHRLTRIQEICR